jgi:hypothetical protein
MREWRCNSTIFYLGINGSEWSASLPGRFAPAERAPSNHWIGGWVGPRADAVEKRKIFSGN